MPITPLQQLEIARARVAELEQAVADELNAELANLHARYGFDDVEVFLVAVKDAALKPGRRGRPAKAKAVESLPIEEKPRKRAKITNAIRAKVKKLIEAGQSGSKVAKAVGISLPSVQNIKKAFGLVKPRGGKAEVEKVVKAKRTKVAKAGKSKKPAKVAKAVKPRKGAKKAAAATPATPEPAAAKAV